MRILLALGAVLFLAASAKPAEADVRIGRSRGIVGGVGAGLFGGRRAVVVAPHAAIGIAAAPLRFAPLRAARFRPAPVILDVGDYYVPPASFRSSFRQFNSFCQ